MGIRIPILTFYFFDSDRWFLFPVSQRPEGNENQLWAQNAALNNILRSQFASLSSPEIE